MIMMGFFKKPVGETKARYMATQGGWIWAVIIKDYS